MKANTKVATTVGYLTYRNIEALALPRGLERIDGRALINSLRERAPRLPVVAMSGVLLGTSGRTALDQLRNIAEFADVVCLQKPFRPRELLQAVTAALAAGGSPANAAHPVSHPQT